MELTFYIQKQNTHTQNTTTVMPQDFSGIAVVFDTSNIGKAGLNSIRIVAGRRRNCSQSSSRL